MGVAVLRGEARLALKSDRAEVPGGASAPPEAVQEGALSPHARSAVLSAQRFAGNPLRLTAASEWPGRAEFESARFFSSSAETRCPP